MVGGDDVGVHHGGGERRLGDHPAVRSLPAAALVEENRLKPGIGVTSKETVNKHKLHNIQCITKYRLIYCDASLSLPDTSESNNTYGALFFSF